MEREKIDYIEQPMSEGFVRIEGKFDDLLSDPKTAEPILRRAQSEFNRVYKEVCPQLSDRRPLMTELDRKVNKTRDDLAIPERAGLAKIYAKNLIFTAAQLHASRHKPYGEKR